MSRVRRPNRKAPDIDVLSRHYLGVGLSRHPDIAKHVERLKRLSEPRGRTTALIRESGRACGVQATTGINPLQSYHRRSI
jgi:hypothetical protein